jgi:hypothetical protein
VVTIPLREMKARGLREGQLVGFDPVPLELRSAAPPRLSPKDEADLRGGAAGAQPLYPRA